MKIKQRIILVSVSSAFIPVLIILLIIILQKASTSETIVKEMTHISEASIKNSVASIADLCKISNEMITQTIASSFYTFNNEISKVGGIHVESGNQVQWKAINQETKIPKEISLPKVFLGGNGLNANYDISVPIPILDNTSKLTGSALTVFQRMNEQGDMLRVATTIVGKDGRRAVGTYIPAIASNGTKNPIISNILNNQQYTGSAFVVDKNYLVEYKPLKDKSGRIIGMLFAGIAPDAMPSLRKAITEHKVGKSGYVYCISTQGLRKGYYVISLKGKRDGEEIWNTKDADGHYVIQEIIQKATALDENEIGIVRYPWKNAGEIEAKNKIVAVKYFKDFDWVIGAGTFEDEFYESANVAKSKMNDLVWYSVIVGFLVIAAMVLFSMYMGGIIANPIIKTTKAMSMLAKGNFNEAERIIKKK